MLREQVEKVGISNNNKRNVLHLAALHASTEAMDMLSRANLLGLDEEARDKDRHSPNECFLKCRSSHCAVARKSFDVEKRSWVRLMKSARTPTEESVILGDVDEGMGMVSQVLRDKRNDSGFFSDSGSDSMSEEEYMDAYDGDEKEDWPHEL